MFLMVIDLVKLMRGWKTPIMEIVVHYCGC